MESAATADVAPILEEVTAFLTLLLHAAILPPQWQGDAKTLLILVQRATERHAVQGGE